MGAWEITKKDLRLILKDKGALYTLLALPVVFIAILGLSTGELITTHESSRLLKVGVLDEDGSELSKQVYHDLSHIGGLAVGTVPNRDDANLYLQDGRCSVVVFLGKNFHDIVEDLDPADVVDLEHGRLAQGLSALDVHVECAAEFAQVAELVEYVVLSAVLRAIAPDVLKRNRLIATLLNRMIEKHRNDLQDGRVGPAPVKPHGNIIYQTLVPAFMVMFAFFLVNIMASSFINERKLGTLRRLQMSRVSPVQLLWGKTLPFLIVSITQCTLLFLSGKFMFGMSWGTYPAMLIPVLLTTSFSATGLGLLLATMVRTESQVTSYSTFLVIVLAGISGCYMPRDWLPELMKTISLATPHAWALIAYEDLLTRAQPDFGLVLRCCGVLAAMGTACFVAGCLRFRRLEYPVT